MQIKYGFGPLNERFFSAVGYACQSLSLPTLRFKK